MKFLPLVWAGLWRKPARAALTTLSLIAAFTLFGMLRSVDAGFDRLIAAGMENRLFTYSRFFNTPLPFAYVDQIARLDGVAEVGYTASINGYYRDPKTFFYIGGGSPNVFDMFPEFEVDKSAIEALRAKPNGVVLSPGMAKHLGGVKIGDHVVLHGNVKQANGSEDWDVEVVGFMERHDSPGIFTFSIGNYSYVNEARADQKNTLQQIQVLVTDPKRALQIARAIDALFLNSSTPTQTTVDARFWRGAVASLGNTKLIINGILACVLIVLLLLTTTTLAQSVDERRAEFAVMKTLGYTDLGILSVVFAEAAAQCLLAAVTGLGLSAALSPFVQSHIPGPTIQLRMPVEVFAAGIVAAMVVAALAAVIPGWRASRMQIAEALAKR